jgi:adenylate kinase
MSDRYETILLFGAPGSGKGTQGKVLAQIPGFFHSSTGDIFRNLDANSELGKLFFQFSSRGELVPDDLTMRIWHQNVYAHTILQLFKPHADLLVLDGLPRSVGQARLLYRYCNVLAVVHLMCKDHQALFDRMRKRALKLNRADDAKPEVIKRRFEVYQQETMPVLEFYEKGVVREVDATGSPVEVLHEILNVLAPIQKAHFEKVGEVGAE